MHQESNDVQKIKLDLKEKDKDINIKNNDGDIP